MDTLTFVPQSMDQLDLTANIPSAGWLWNGYIARGSLTLLTSQWKAGKTTLLSGLLQRLGDGQPFLNRECEVAKVLVVSEEAAVHWHQRLRAMPVGRHAQLLPRPFRGRNPHGRADA